ncbi:MAG: hypothetical protein Q8O19_05330, partial [Rectinemataceae bacterium]|nr:hypothetical protein [Rectinemataceae bacterium]
MKIGDGSIVALFDKTPPVKGPNDVHCPHFWELKYANGCHYDCQWCLDGATLILRPDLSWRRLDTLQVGDLVMGFGKFGSTMKFAATPIQAIKKVIKPRLELITDRTKTISSYDHKFLSEGRWIKAKYLGTSNFGINFLTRPSNRTPENAAYMAGYLHGISDGDGSMGIYGKEQKVYKYRLAMQDSDAIDRAYKYFKVFGIEMNRFEHNAGSGTILDAIRKDGRFNHSKIIELFNAYKESIDYHAGYAAGIFDAEGCLSSMRISNTNPDILKRIRSSLSSLRVPHKEETYENHCSTIRIVGGIQEHLRFFNIANPAIARKWPGNFTARFDRTSPVITANRLGPGELIDIQTGTENFIANGLASHNCYLNGTFRHKPTGKEPTRKDRDKLSKDLEQALTTLPPTIFNAGEVSDALVYEDDLESVVLPLFEKHKDKGHKILLLTKSNSTRLLRWGHMKDSIIMAYSINSRSVAQVWERA